MRARKILLALLVPLLVIGGILWWLRGSPASRAEDCFRTIARGFEQGSVGDVLSRVDRDYPVYEMWPRMRDAAWDPDADPRDTVHRALFFFFKGTREQERTMTWEIHALEALPGEHRDYEATVTVGLRVSGGGRWNLDPPLERHRFVLRQRGWLFPTMRILSHDPIRP